MQYYLQVPGNPKLKKNNNDGESNTFTIIFYKKKTARINNVLFESISIRAA